MRGFMERLFVVAWMLLIPATAAAMVGYRVDVIWNTFAVVFGVWMWVMGMWIVNYLSGWRMW